MIRSRIFTIRGVQVMLDRDLAELYHVMTGRIIKLLSLLGVSEIWRSGGINLPKLGNWDLFRGVGFGIIFAYRRGGETPCCCV